MREMTMGTCPDDMATSMLPRPDCTMAATTSVMASISPGARLNDSDGSLLEPWLFALWKISLPAAALLDGLKTCTEVLKFEPKLPAVDPTTGMIADSDACGAG